MTCALFVGLALLAGFALGYRLAGLGFHRDARALMAESEFLRVEAQRLLNEARLAEQCNMELLNIIVQQRGHHDG